MCAKWEDSDQYLQLSYEVSQLEEEMEQGAAKFSEQILQQEMTLVTEEDAMLARIRGKLTEHPDALDQWFVQVRRHDAANSN